MTSTQSESDRSFISFSVGPVQTFIAAARTVRDLWTGSFLISWLIRQAMEPLLPLEARNVRLVTPARAEQFTRDNLLSPCLPNGFVAEVSAAQAEHFAQECRKASLAAWADVCKAVRSRLDQKVRDQLPAKWAASWARLWDAQVKSPFEIRTCVLPWTDCPPELLDQLMPNWETPADASPDDLLWTKRHELLGGILAAGKMIRQLPDYRPEPDEKGLFPQKCSILGSYEQMGPAELRDSAGFWKAFAEEVEFRGSRTRKREKLCAVSLVKRFAWPAYFAKGTATHPEKLRFDDTATVAAADWLVQANGKGFRLGPDHVKRWSGQWLHWPRPDFDEEEESCPKDVFERIREARRPGQCGAPPLYYALLMLDGDKMGDKFRAAVGREGHARISKALAWYARERVEQIVQEDHNGTLIYAGGDDVLAVLPTSKAIACAQALAVAFTENWRQAGLRHPEQATVSAGLAVVHSKEDLRFALDTARRAEKAAKEGGRNALMLTVCRRSGEHTSALCPWEFVDRVEAWVEAFLGGASDRWAYHLAADVSVLKALDEKGLRKEIQRQLGRAEESTKKALPPASVGQAFLDYREMLLAEKRRPEDPDFWQRFPTAKEQAQELTGRALQGFVTLCQSASFLARGRDQR